MPVTLQRKGGILLVQGLDISKPAEYIGEQSSPNVQNFRVDRSLLVKRTGTEIRGDTMGGIDIEIMHGREFTREGTLFNVRAGVDHVERYNTGTSAWVDITGTTFTGDANDLICSAVPQLAGKRILCITNGIDTIQKWTGSGSMSDLGGTPPVAKFIQEYKSYLVCANIQGGTDVAQRVQWSDTADPEEWSAGNSGAVDLIEDGEDITGLNVYGDFLCVHKKSSIYIGSLVSSSIIFRFERKATQAGTVANGSIVNLPTREQIFLAEDGLRVFNGVSAPLIPSPINDEIRDDLNMEYAHKAWGILVKDEDEVWIGVPIGSEERGTTVYKYKYKTGVLYKDKRSDINTAWRATQTSGLTWDEASGSWDSQVETWNAGQSGAMRPEIHFGDINGLTTVQSLGSASDNGVAIDALWESKDLQSEIIGQLLRFQEILLWAKGSGTLDIEYSTDEGENWLVASGSPVTLTDSFPDETSPMRVYVDIVALKMRVRFRHSSETGTVAIKQYYVGYVPREII